MILKKATEFLGTSINKLNSKDYIAAQHLLRIIDELEIAIIDLSVKADENVKIINAFEAKERNLNMKENKKIDELNGKNFQLFNMDKEICVYNIFKERLNSDAYRNLLPKEKFEEIINEKLSLPIIFWANSNIDIKVYARKSYEQRVSYVKELTKIAHIHKYNDNVTRKYINEIYNSVSVIASIGLVERKLLKYVPFKKIFLRNKDK